MVTEQRFSDADTARIAEANGLKDVIWMFATVHGTLAGFQNGTSRLLGTPHPACRRWPLKRKYRQR
jgi:hypothetical protein